MSGGNYRDGWECPKYSGGKELRRQALCRIECQAVIKELSKERLSTVAECYT